MMGVPQGGAPQGAQAGSGNWTPSSKVTAATLAVPGGAVLCWMGNHFFNLGIDAGTAGAFVGILAAGVGYLVPEKWHHTVYEEPPQVQRAVVAAEVAAEVAEKEGKVPRKDIEPKGGEHSGKQTEHSAKVAPVPGVHSGDHGWGGSGDTDMGSDGSNAGGRTAGSGGSNWSHPDVWGRISAQDEVVMTGPIARLFYMVIGAAVVYAAKVAIKRLFFSDS